MKFFLFEWFIGFRYLKSRQRRGFISLITFISIAGVCVGVMSLIIVLSVMNGFENDLREKIIGVKAHLIITSPDNKLLSHYRPLLKKVAKISYIKACAPFLSTQVMLKTRTNVKGVFMKGIDPHYEKKVTQILHQIKYGRSFLEKKERKEKSPAPLLIGAELAREMEVKVGDKITAISPVFVRTSVGKVPLMKDFVIEGIFQSGYYEYDSTVVYALLPDCQVLYRLGDVITGVAAKVEDIFAAPKLARFLQRTLNYQYAVRDWTSMNVNLFKAIKIEKMVMFIILFLIILVAVFNIISTLIMVVMEKTKEIGILKSLGAQNWSIMFIFMTEGLIIGLVGTLFGCVLGILGCLLIKIFNFSLPGGGEVYYITHLPVKMVLSQIVLVVVTSISISFLSTFYPAINAARLNPALTLRYE